ncbi:MAG: hypothetical protein R3C05_19175 [Pirellulaceae bacterium]
MLKSGTDVDIQAKAVQKLALNVDGTLTPSEGGKKFAVGAAVAVGFYENTVDAIVDDERKHRRAIK